MGTLFRDWWRQGFAAWQSRHLGTNSGMVFLSELGSPDYAITDADGKELSDRWTEALLLQRWAREIWDEAANAQV